MAVIMAKQKLMLLLTIIICIPVMVIGCKGVDMSSPRKTVEGYIEALENYDYGKMAQCLGQEPVHFPKGPDLEFRNVIIAVTSQTDTRATVYAEWEVWVEYEDMMLPAEDLYFKFELMRVGDKWVITDLYEVPDS